ncbi:MAG: hypothetical protein ACRENX_09855 [Candidatus Dormibacteria bacterium]
MLLAVNLPPSIKGELTPTKTSVINLAGLPALPGCTNRVEHRRSRWQSRQRLSHHRPPSPSFREQP